MNLVSYILRQPRLGRDISVNRDAAGHGWAEIGGGLFGRPAEIGLSREQYEVLRYALTRAPRRGRRPRSMLGRADRTGSV